MQCFKPKNAVYNGQAPRRQEQPFYVSWFQQQGELKRGGTAPQESRKAMEQMRSQQQQPFQQPTIFKPPEPVTKNNQQRFKNSPYLVQPRVMRSNLQEISKIYNANGTGKAFLQKRKSHELSVGRGEPKNYSQFTRTYGPGQGMYQRTYTSSQQRHQISDEKRPVSQQQAGGRQGMKAQVYEEDIFQGDLGYEEEYQNVQRQDDENLSDIVDSDDGMDVDDRIGHTNIDAMSNESQGAESKRNSLSPRNQDDDQIANRSAFQQRDEATHVVESLRRTTATMNRPMTSEGGRRKRQLQQNKQQLLSDEKSRTTQNLVVQTVDTHDSLQVIQESPQNHGCQFIQDFDENEGLEEIQPMQILRRGVDYEDNMLPGKNEDITSLNLDFISQRPPSRHKFPTKAVCLEVPNTAPVQDIPIKSMYANVGDENSFEDMLKVNNKVNLSNFMRRGTEGKVTNPDQEESDKRPTYQSDQGERLQPVVIKSGRHHAHPQSANTKYKGGFQMSPMMNQVQPPLSSKAIHSNTENFEIVIKHNTSSNLQKPINPVKLPFQTSLGQDFLRLFANQHFT